MSVFLLVDIRSTMRRGFFKQKSPKDFGFDTGKGQSTASIGTANLRNLWVGFVTFVFLCSSPKDLEL